ncbi:MAG: acetolactate synthase large subunit, partial [Myxococcota bacterium]|nr:acetolactate synthase large subunit [Myxococcota bacterium]
VSGFVRTARRPEDLAADGAEALAAAWGPPGAVATLVVPADCQWGPAAGPATPPPRPGLRPGPSETLEAALKALPRAGRDAVLLLGGDACAAPGLRAAARIAAATGCRAFVETWPARLERGAGLPALPKLPYFPEQAVEALAGCTDLVLAGAADPVAFFGYPDGPSRLAPEGCARHRVAGPGEDAAAALEALADELGAAQAEPPAPPRPGTVDGPLTPDVLGRVVAALQPVGAVVVDESATSGLPWSLHAAGAAPHLVLGLTGGAIGQGLPCAVGAALAAPDRRVLCLQADGSGLYTLQALWTLAREGLDVTVVVCANRAYRILQVELARAGVAEPGPKARALTDLGHPAPDWVALATGLGVPARRADTGETLAEALRAALAEPGPGLIEAVL